MISGYFFFKFSHKIFGGTKKVLLSLQPLWEGYGGEGERFYEFLNFFSDSVWRIGGFPVSLQPDPFLGGFRRRFSARGFRFRRPPRGGLTIGSLAHWHQEEKFFLQEECFYKQDVEFRRAGWAVTRVMRSHYTGIFLQGRV